MSSPQTSIALYSRSGSDEPRPGLVFYPAPVPRILDLPPKLSTWRSTRAEPLETPEVEEPRQIDGYGENTAIGLTETGKYEEEKNPRATKEVLPSSPSRARRSLVQRPQLLDLQVQNHSAIATLDMLLEASAHAPVSAFTDHLIAGGTDAGIFYTSRHQMPNEEAREHTPDPLLKVTYRVDGDAQHPQTKDPPEDGENQDLNHRPNTLLAELEIRKRQQLSRNKAAAHSFPNGLRASLLQLDVVAQMQSDARKNKSVTLAWEGATGSQDPNAEDDLPLALLYTKFRHAESGGDKPDDLPRQQLDDDSELLATRRMRLRGESSQEGITNVEPQFRFALDPITSANTSFGGIRADETDEKEETLAQRRLRMQVQAALPSKHTLEQGFNFSTLNDVVPLGLSLTGIEVDKEEKGYTEDDEPLTQRRQRLRSEKVGQSAQYLKSRKHESDATDARASGTVHGLGREESSEAAAAHQRRNTPFSAQGPPVAMIEQWRQSLQ